MDELKPVRCGCGGEAEIDWVLQPDGVYMTGVYCENCGTKTIPFWSMEKNKAIDYAVTTWNRAMGADQFRDITKKIEPSAEPERKTGTWEVQPSTGEDRPFIWWKCSVCGHVIFSETERDRREFHAFCGRCGADMRGENEPY